jgi:hypothetical protein
VIEGTEMVGASASRCSSSSAARRLGARRRTRSHRTRDQAGRFGSGSRPPTTPAARPCTSSCPTAVS